jgi:hypothetical protein
MDQEDVQESQKELAEKDGALLRGDEGVQQAQGVGITGCEVEGIRWPDLAAGDPPGPLVIDGG